jgi:hypothetical protein
MLVEVLLKSNHIYWHALTDVCIGPHGKKQRYTIITDGLIFLSLLLIFRFKNLDRGGKGYLERIDLMAIPEVNIVDIQCATGVVVKFNVQFLKFLKKSHFT